MRFSLILTTVLLGAAACVDVSSPVVVGYRVLDAEPSEWEGRWVNSDGFAFELKVVDAKQGILSVSWIENQGEQPIEKISTCYVRDVDSYALFSLQLESDDSSPDGFLWGRIERKGDEMFLIGPEVEFVRRLVADGIVPGTIHPGHVALVDVSSSEMAEFIRKWKYFIFDVRNPVNFRRVRSAG